MTRLEEARVAVLMGGRSGEREVSLRSGGEIATALRQARQGPARVLEVEVLADGCWRVEEAALRAAEAVARLDSIDLFFLGLHGGDGEDGTLQGLLAGEDRAFTGSGVGASALCMDKVVARDLAAFRGTEVARARVLRPGASAAEVAAALAGVAAGGARVVVKPRHGGSSVDTVLTSDAAEARGVVEVVLAQGEEVLLETVVEGVEATVPVLGNRGGPLRALTPVEIRPKDGRFFDYEEKYAEGGALELVPPERLDAAAQERLRALALDLHDGFRLDGCSRVDFIVRPDGSPVFLEVNTLPGMTSRSLLPKSAAHVGLDFPALCCEIARLGLCAERRSRPGAGRD